MHSNATSLMTYIYNYLDKQKELGVKEITSRTPSIQGIMCISILVSLNVPTEMQLSGI